MATTTRQTLYSIRQNWSIPPTDLHLIPPSFLAGLPPSHLSPTLLAAIHRLSTLTLGQRDRAYNLLNTYFQARMRERGSAAGQHDGGVLEVGDVEKACGSAKKMSCVGVMVEQQGRIDSVYTLDCVGNGGQGESRSAGADAGAGVFDAETTGGAGSDCYGAELCAGDDGGWGGGGDGGAE
ncbi:hypothetical protein GGP41_006654 [Bipolaris sorokiniana]|uniref:Uncharacterized protein n=1 Tax=Cochliobolus sativus TaxID=45130 RepID=A0A8H5ZRH8_COCSA|nr:hypothetical protein GGP41_006654 [Bipolaris sorokiniana]